MTVETINTAGPIRDRTEVRPVIAQDIDGLRRVIDLTGLFPGKLLEGMLSGYLSGNPSGEMWLTTGGSEPVAVVYGAPERLTDGTWNMLLLAVRRDSQKRGVGSILVRALEQALRAQQARLLLVETSGLDEFEGTREFYRKSGYEQEARIRSFYRDGEDKIVFRKVLAGA
jgi:ribosomal protein S18 acetylase RimI-like enzyme